ncbi:cytochrome P450 [Reticulibacter mediterranei]|uniref:Cytochrome P450 n=1 Tax=Reticulibacter mediterranei TaxID=2778369 RepID=A0A8J3IPJ6_9CHLR|nr:cytochrome P450 [Reticulibacter mediterranei]GHO97833.1 cytochrome P450 [Reticulibacter mediterranei]
MSHYTWNDFTSPTFKENPFPAWEDLRTTEPLYRFPVTEGQYAWMVTRYEDAQAILKDQRFIKNRMTLLSEEEKAQIDRSSPTLKLLSYNMLAADAPDHSRLRRLVSKTFTPRMIEGLRNRIQQITNDLLDQAQERGEMNLINDFAFPLPVTVICEMLGIPAEDRQQFRKWSNAILDQSGPFDADRQAPPEVEEFTNYVRQLIATKSEHPDDGLVSQLVRVEEDGDRLSENELISMIFLLIVAGHETTVNLIASGMLALLQHPDQLRLLQDNPSLIVPAIEELLRYTAPVIIGTGRWASEDIELHDTLIPKGDMVLVSLMGANTDPAHFAAPADLDITREENEHIAFGKGIHFCLGAPLARLEGQVAISTLLRRLPDLHLQGDAQELKWRPGLILRGLQELPVAF